MLIIKIIGEIIFENIIKAIGIISILTVFLIIGYILYKLVCIIFELNDKKIRLKNL